MREDVFDFDVFVLGLEIVQNGAEGVVVTARLVVIKGDLGLGKGMGAAPSDAATARPTPRVRDLSEKYSMGFSGWKDVTPGVTAVLDCAFPTGP